MVAGKRTLVVVWLLCCGGIRLISSDITNSLDAAALLSLKNQWENTPPSWSKSDDPCGERPWEGVTCNHKARVVTLSLASMGLKGTLPGDIGQLSELTHLDLSFNDNLTGPLPSALGNLRKLTFLILANCGFSGNIPPELGNLSELLFLALTSNNFAGKIPNSIGNLSKVYWLDMADNQLSGPIPVSTPTVPGLDCLLKAKHFHFNNNKLSGTIPPQLFSSEMELIHVLLDGNQLTGSIPSTLGLVTNLSVVRLDRNFLTGEVPSNLNNLTNVIELNLRQNKLSGPMPNLTGMDALNSVDLSDNNFEATEAPEWFSNLRSLFTLVIENGPLTGPVPQELFSAPGIQLVILRNNSFNGTLDMGDSISQQLQLVDFDNNNIASVTIGSRYQNILNLSGNPFCKVPTVSDTKYCQLQQASKRPYSTSLAKCGGKYCTENQKLNPLNCECAYPYEGTMYFRAPISRVLSDANMFQVLEKELWTKLGLKPHSVSLQNTSYDNNGYIQVVVELFPSYRSYFERSDVQRIGSLLANQTIQPSNLFGPYSFVALPYNFQDVKTRKSFTVPLIIGIAAACTLLLLLVVGVGIYAMKQKSRAENALSLSRPFVSWGSSGKYSGKAPQLKGARYFSYSELKKCTNNFSDQNEIGSGGYGKVYKGLLADGQQVAIKRCRAGSRQGGHEFKTEIELLSRVHHKNLVSLLGFCVEQGEQMLVYEFMPNGSLRESLSGKSGIFLDWRRRLRIALGSARGVAYLHDHANPPIIHRDIKSTNILLDENLTAKVADFGLCKLIADTGKGYVTTQVKGTMGYLDPEYYSTQQLTEKSDVYSFGVLMLELITARQPIEMGKYVVREVTTSIDKNDKDFCGLSNMIDPSLKSLPNLNGFAKFVELAMNCLKETALERPMMSDVVKEIETILQEDGINTGSTSTSSSVTNFGNTKGIPYDALLAKRGDAFEYSGEFMVSTQVDPK